MDNKDLIYFKNRIDSIDWDTDVGCAEDFERYEENFVNRLEEEGLLTKELSELFRQNTNRRQG